MLNKDKQVVKLTGLLRQVLETLGEDPDRKGLERTPERWAKALLTYTEGAEVNPEEHLSVTFDLAKKDQPEHPGDMIILDNIHFTSTCEHHMAPFTGVVHIAYIPDPENYRITGLSKLSRVVDVFSKRLQIQERLTQEIGSAIFSSLAPLGVIVTVQGLHFCMVQRGVQQPGSTAVTTSRWGTFVTDKDLESKFQSYLLMRMEPRGLLH